MKYANNNKIGFNNHNSDNRGSGRGVTGREAGFRRARSTLDRMADKQPAGSSIISVVSLF